VPRFGRGQLLIQAYRRFFSDNGRRAVDLNFLNPANGPSVHILTTSLTTGLQCEFSAKGFGRLDVFSVVAHVENPRFDIPFAVAASSAFPPLFPPIRIDTKTFGIPRKDFGVDMDHLTDGGIYDNLGLTAAMKVLCDDGGFRNSPIVRATIQGRSVEFAVAAKK
jgi:predicted acylesterase/phospholipase RssA